MKHAKHQKNNTLSLFRPLMYPYYPYCAPNIIIFEGQNAKLSIKQTKQSPSSSHFDFAY